jgi:hypothetical protein
MVAAHLGVEVAENEERFLAWDLTYERVKFVVKLILDFWHISQCWCIGTDDSGLSR